MKWYNFLLKPHTGSAFRVVSNARDVLAAAYEKSGELRPTSASATSLTLQRRLIDSEKRKRYSHLRARTLQARSRGLLARQWCSKGTATTLRRCSAPGKALHAAAPCCLTPSVPLRPKARFLTPSRTARRFQSPEGCRFGDRCNFAHGDDEIRSRPEGATAHRTLTCSSPTVALSDATAALRRLPRRRSVQQRRAAKPVRWPWQLGRRRRRARCSTGASCDP